MAKKDFMYWVAYPQKITQVWIVRRGTGGRRLRNPVENPVTVIDGDENEYVVSKEQIHDNPIAATEASIKMASCLGVNPMVGVPDEDDEEDDSDEDGEEDLGEDEGEDLEEDPEDDEDSEEDEEE